MNEERQNGGLFGLNCAHQQSIKILDENWRGNEVKCVLNNENYIKYEQILSQWHSFLQCKHVQVLIGCKLGEWETTFVFFFSKIQCSNK